MKLARTGVCPVRGAFAAAGMFALLTAGATAPARARDLPSYATREETIRGRIMSVTGSHRLELRDDRGFVDTVSLHDGTVINPTGLRLAAGLSATIIGHTSGKTFEAHEIDTPYSSYPAAPLVAVAPAPYAYPPDGYYAPYGYAPFGYYGYPYVYRGYGPRFAFRFGYFGRGYYRHAFYGRSRFGRGVSVRVRV